MKGIMNKRQSNGGARSALGATLAGACLLLAACSNGTEALATTTDEKAHCVESVNALFTFAEGEPQLMKLTSPDPYDYFAGHIGGGARLCGESSGGEEVTTVRFMIEPTEATEFLTGVRELSKDGDRCTFLRESTVEQQPCLLEDPTPQEYDKLVEALTTELRKTQEDLPEDADFKLLDSEYSEFKLLRFND